MLDNQIKQDLASPERVFLFAALTSQIISNVPATVLLAKLTGQWQALLWGVSVGGFGSLLGSFANLIAYRLYLREMPARAVPGFTLKFMALGYVAFVLGILLYVSWRML